MIRQSSAWRGRPVEPIVAPVLSTEVSGGIGNTDQAGYQHSERAADTVPQALICALDATDFEDAIRNAISIGGDSDTIAAIAGGVAEAIFGINEAIATQAWGYLPQDMRAALDSLYKASPQSGSR